MRKMIKYLFTSAILLVENSWIAISSKLKYSLEEGGGSILIISMLMNLI